MKHLKILEQFIAEAKKFKAGDKWSKDFDYQGMLAAGLKVNVNTPIKKLNKLYDSFTDVNYHTIAKGLGIAIDWIEDNDKKGAVDYMDQFHKAVQDELKVNEGINLKQAHLSSEEYQKAKKLKAFDSTDWVWNPKSNLYDKVSESVNEASRGKVYKAAKKGSYPVTLVVISNGMVIKQELVKTPELVPAAFNILQKEYPNANISVEDNTGKRLFSESVNEARLNQYTVLVWHKGEKSWESEDDYQLPPAFESLPQAKKYANERYKEDKDYSWAVYDNKKNANVFVVGNTKESVNEGSEYYVIQSKETGSPKYVKDIGWKVRDKSKGPKWVSDRNISKAYKFKTLRDAQKYLDGYEDYQNKFWSISKLKESVNEADKYVDARGNFKLRNGLEVKIKPASEIKKLNISKDYMKYNLQIAGKTVKIEKAFRGEFGGAPSEFTVKGYEAFETRSSGKPRVGFYQSIIDDVVRESVNESKNIRIILTGDEADEVDFYEKHSKFFDGPNVEDYLIIPTGENEIDCKPNKLKSCEAYLKKNNIEYKIQESVNEGSNRYRVYMNSDMDRPKRINYEEYFEAGTKAAMIKKAKEYIKDKTNQYGDPILVKVVHEDDIDDVAWANESVNKSNIPNFENFNINEAKIIKDYMSAISIKDFKNIKKGDEVKYMGGTYTVTRNNGYTITLQGSEKHDKAFDVNYSMFNHGGMILEGSSSDGGDKSNGNSHHDDHTNKSIAQHWKDTYGEEFHSKYPAVAKIIKSRPGIDKRELKRIWEETYGENFEEQYPALWQKID